jgi:hypothetical protein
MSDGRSITETISISSGENFRRGIINFEDTHKNMFHAKYLSSSSLVYLKKISLKFLLYAYRENQ